MPLETKVDVQNKTGLQNLGELEKRANYKKFTKILWLCMLWMILPFTAFAKMQEIMDEKGASKKNNTK